MLTIYGDANCRSLDWKLRVHPTKLSRFCDKFLFQTKPIDTRYVCERRSRNLRQIWPKTRFQHTFAFHEAGGRGLGRQWQDGEGRARWRTSSKQRRTERQDLTSSRGRFQLEKWCWNRLSNCWAWTSMGHPTWRFFAALSPGLPTPRCSFNACPDAVFHFAEHGTIPWCLLFRG